MQVEHKNRHIKEVGGVVKKLNEVTSITILYSAAAVPSPATTPVHT